MRGQHQLQQLPVVGTLLEHVQCLRALLQEGIVLVARLCQAIPSVIIFQRIVVGMRWQEIAIISKPLVVLQSNRDGRFVS